MITEKELMKLVADYGKECISAGIAEMSLSDALKQRMAEDVRAAHVALTDRLRALLAELEAAREDAARWHEVAFGPSPFLGVFYVDHFGNEHMLYEQEAVDVVDAARKGGA